ncbi:MAG: sigma-70 family RNA polymerase sigma factor [Rivularia sp. (in: Bacteria)]|nr:sigma-70 family RNA polymerase sigma factor [Rivularia sp. MS3]
MLEKKRKNVVDKFSSFICFTEDNHQIRLHWKIDAELKKNIQSKVKADPEAKESFWAQHFLKVLLVQSSTDNQNLVKIKSQPCLSTAKKHFSAYLQEACFKAARDIYNEFKYIKHKYSLEEYFQIANIAASTPSKFFKNFNFERHQINIEAYAITAFKRFIRNQIYRQDLEARRTRFSSYGLLKDLNARELTEALQAQSFSVQKIVSYRLAWQCFCEIFQITANNLNNRTRSPSQPQLLAIANYYNQRCNQLHLFNPLVTDIEILEMLSTCIKAAKNYRHKQYLYFEENYCAIAESTASVWDVMINKEECQQIEIILNNLFKHMPEQCQTLFNLWQGLNLTQTEIANLVKYKYPELQKQYQVARQLKKYGRKILEEFAFQWNKTNPEISLNDEKDIERIKSALDKCLQQYCQEMFLSALNDIWEAYSDEERQNILISFNYKRSLLVKLQADESGVNNDSQPVNSQLLEKFKKHIETTMCLKKDSLSVVNYKIANIVNEWIQSKQR